MHDLPRRLRIMSEDLVAFRDQSGAVGLLELHCPHRGTSLEFGLIAAKGLRCCYHGWLFDVDVEENPQQLVKIAALGIKDGNEVIIGRERIRP